MDGGAVVVSGTIEAGGGSDKSMSADGSGSWTGRPPPDCEGGCCIIGSIFLTFLFAVAAVNSAD